MLNDITVLLMKVYGTKMAKVSATCAKPMTRVSYDTVIRIMVEIYFSSKALLPQLSLGLSRLLGQTLLVLLSCSLHRHPSRPSADLTTCLHLLEVDLLGLAILTSQVQDVLTSLGVLRNYW